MGKRKRHNQDAGRTSMDVSESSMDGYHSYKPTSTTEDARHTASSNISFRAGQAESSDRSRNVRVHLESPVGAHAASRKGKKPRKRKSHHHSEDAGSTAAPIAKAPGSVAKDHINRTAEEGLDESLLPSGQSRHQRRRWRRKLIKHDLMPKDERRGSGNAVHQKSRRKSSSHEHESTSWLEMPVGQKALARQFATTTLMQPPARRWDDRGARVHAEAELDASTPWQRSAAEGEDVILPGSSIGGESDVENVVSLPPQAAPSISIISTAPARSRRSHLAESSSMLSDSLRLSLPSGLPTSTKQHFFSNKATSVPTYSASGDLADRFRRFSAAAHGKPATAGESSSENSSDTSSSASDDGGRRKGPYAEPVVGLKAPVQQLNNIEDQYDGEDPDALPQLDGNAETYQREARDSANRGELNARAASPELMASDRTVSGPQTGAHRSGVLVHAGRERSSSQPSARDLQSALPFASLDDPSFDAEQAIDEVFSYEMKLTREMPGKKRLSIHADREDGYLTQGSSHCRMTRSASKRESTLFGKGLGDLMPHPVNGAIVVQSMRLPEDPSFFDRHLGAGDELPLGTLDDVEITANDDGPGSITANATSQHDLSSELSELEKSPSPPPATKAGYSATTNDQAQPLNNNDYADDESDTIIVAAAEEMAEPKKKRRMTGRTSKHFSTPKTKRVNSKADSAAPKKSDLAESLAKNGEPGKGSIGKRKRTCVDQDLLAETRALLDLPSPAADEVPSPRPKKKSRRSSGTIANLSASNVIESRSRHSARRASQELDRSEDNIPVEAAVESEKTAEPEQPPDQTEPTAQSKKRKRPSGGTITDLDASNIIERRSRRSESKEIPEREDGTVKVRKVSLKENDDSAAKGVEVEAEEADQNPKPKKRARTSGGKITDLDTGNIVESRSRRRKGTQSEDIIQADEAAQHEASPAVDDADREEAEGAEQPAPKAKPKRKTTGKRNIYFTPPKPALDPNIIDRVDFFNTTGKKGRVPAGVSIAPVPSINSDRFGIIQEKLWQEPFWLIIAVTFLNKTAGRAAAPVFWKLKEKYATPEALAEADQGELCEMIWHLGLQTQRSKRLIAIAKAWVEAPPVKGTRWRVLHYPSKGDGKELKAGVPVEEDADEIAGAVEIGRIPGCGPYALDSWRIFCRDMLRGVADDYNCKNTKKEDFVPEWQKVLPLDKELRACLRWMWLREGWIWDPVSGEKREATEEEMERAVQGEMEVEDPKEREFAARAAGVEIEEGGKESKEDAVAGAEAEEEGADERPSTPPAQQATASGSARKSPRGKKRPATPELDDDDLSDNIVVGSPAKKARTSPRTRTVRTREDDDGVKAT